MPCPFCKSDANPYDVSVADGVLRVCIRASQEVVGETFPPGSFIYDSPKSVPMFHCMDRLPLVVCPDCGIQFVPSDDLVRFKATKARVEERMREYAANRKVPVLFEAITHPDPLNGGTLEEHECRE